MKNGGTSKRYLLDGVHRIRFGFSHLRYHKFKHSFLDAVDPFVAAAQQPKTLFITFLTVPTFQLREKSFSIKSQLLTDPLLIKTKSKLSKLFFMVI